MALTAGKAAKIETRRRGAPLLKEQRMEIRNAGMGYPLLDPYATSAGTGGVDKSGEAATGRARPAEESPAGGDTISVSRDALLLTEARRTAQNTPDVRADRVAELREQKVV